MIVHTPPHQHSCTPGWVVGEDHVPGHPELRFMKNPGAHAAAGSVWECECGKTFVAYYDTRGGFMAALWRPERRREKSRRLRALAAS